MKTLNKSIQTITIQRTFKTSLENVWKAWTQPECVIKWWGPKGVVTKVKEYDFSLNGAWKYEIHMPNDQEFIAKGIFTKIEVFRKIALMASFKPMTDKVELEVLFNVQGDQTELTFNLIHPTEKDRILQENMGVVKGWNSTFDRLNEFLLELNS